jgi:hypothetical protein
MTSRELRARTRRVRHAQQAPSCVQARDGHDKEAPQAGRLRVRQAEQGSRAMKKKTARAEGSRLRQISGRGHGKRMNRKPRQGAVRSSSAGTRQGAGWARCAQEQAVQSASNRGETWHSGHGPAEGHSGELKAAAPSRGRGKRWAPWELEQATSTRETGCAEARAQGA